MVKKLRLRGKQLPINSMPDGRLGHLSDGQKAKYGLVGGDAGVINADRVASNWVVV